MQKIKLGWNAVPASAKKLILEVFESGQFSPGPKVHEFEEKFAKLHKAKHAVFVNSGTDALRLGLLALKEKYRWQDSDQVAVPALTFVATVNVIIQAGLQPFFVDVEMYDYTLNPWNLARRLQNAHSKVRCVMPVHLFGKSCDPYLYEVAKNYRFKVLEDSCETILNPIQGDVSCHSTYMAHHLTTGVGGFALTNDYELSWMMRSFANHGRDPLYLPGHQGSLQAIGKELLKRRFAFDRIGYSNRGTEFEAALGLSQLEGLQENVRLRRMAARELLKSLSTEHFLFPEPENHTFMMFPIVIKEDSKIDKYDFCHHLEKNGIETRDMMPITNQRCYRGMVSEEDFPVAQRVNKAGFYIPCFPNMDVRRIKQVFEAYGLTKSLIQV